MHPTHGSLPVQVLHSQIHLLEQRCTDAEEVACQASSMAQPDGADGPAGMRSGVRNEAGGGARQDVAGGAVREFVTA